MKVHVQRAVTLLLTIALCVGLLIVTVSAESPSLPDRVGSFWDTLFQSLSPTQTPLYKAVQAFLDPGKTPETATSADWGNAYNQYVTNIQNDYGTVMIDNTGSGLIPITGWKLGNSQYTSEVEITSERPTLQGLVDSSSSRRAVQEFYADGITVPLSGSYEILFPSGSVSPLNTGVAVFYCGLRNEDFINVLETQFIDSAVYPAATFGPVVLSKTTSYSFYIHVTLLNKVNGVFRYSPSNYIYLRSKSLLSYPDAPITQEFRIGSIAGDYVYQGDNGQQINAENVQIVNETNKTIYNPVTGATTNMTDWMYDYSTRTYTATTDASQTHTVTYGDSNVTIKEGDTTYNINYAPPAGGGTVDPTPTPTSSPGACVHNYTEAVTTPATCTAVGILTKTCSLCGHKETQQIPATGHTWVVDHVVEDVKTEDGTVTTKGYTVYKCSVCGQEYKDTGGTGPPADGGGEDKPGYLESLLSKILDSIIALINALSEKLELVLNSLFDIFENVPKMFEGFTAFLTSCFAFLPPEIMTFITFGILAMVLIAIFKNFIGK